MGYKNQLGQPERNSNTIRMWKMVETVLISSSATAVPSPPPPPLILGSVPSVLLVTPPTQHFPN